MHNFDMKEIPASEFHYVIRWHTQEGHSDIEDDEKRADGLENSKTLTQGVGGNAFYVCPIATIDNCITHLT